MYRMLPDLARFEWIYPFDQKKKRVIIVLDARESKGDGDLESKS